MSTSARTRATTGSAPPGVEDVGDPAGQRANLGLGEAARRDGRRAEPQAAVALRGLAACVAGQGGAVHGDVRRVQRALGMRGVDASAAQVDEQHVVVGAAAS